MSRPGRLLTASDVEEHRPVHAVWELTLACNLKCRHCGSRAGKRRPNELTTDECLDLVRQLADAGVREVSLIGGEAYLRRDWIEIVCAVADAGMECTLVTGGRNLTDERVRAAAEAGLRGASVSIDGLRESHDAVRGVPGSFDHAVAALERLRAHGVAAAVNTQVSSTVIPELRPLLDVLVGLGVTHWKVQLTVAMGRAADNDELLMQPYQMLELMPLLAELHEEAAPQGLLLQLGNNVGYFGPYEALLRGDESRGAHWSGCYAGRNVLGIEADGTIKGCPSLPTTAYAAGNVRTASLETLWAEAPELAFARERDRDELWGFCGTCYYASVCSGGCSWTAHSLLGRRGNNPYCHHRALRLAADGVRERIERVERAPGTPFDSGRFEIVVEPLPSRAEASRPAPSPAQPRWSPDAELEVCHGCNCHVFAGTDVCPHCGRDVHASRREHDEALASAREAERRLLEALG